jgi:hypothetical protein
MVAAHQRPNITTRPSPSPPPPTITIDEPYTATDSLHPSLAADAAGDRTFTIVNHCNEAIWYKLTPGSVVNPKTGSDSCRSNADCVRGSSCAIPPNLCFWDVPRPSTNTFRLPSKGSSAKILFSSIDNGIDVVWSGNIGACTSSTCDTTGNTGDCDTQGCGPVGGSPTTLAEFTLQKNNIDYYDVEVINGHSMAVEMTPLVHQMDSARVQSLFNTATSDPYTCGNAGGKTPMTGVGACSWQFTPPSYEYRWVKKGGPSCNASDDGQCPGGTVCGISNNVGMVNRLQRTCGPLLGYWSENQICGIDPDFGAPFFCNQRVPSPNVGLTKRNMLMCDGTLKSCYQSDSDASCCGCANWWNDGANVPSVTDKCLNQNTYWSNAVKPGLLWLKKACPTAYTYPYDDKSSTFVCSSSSSPRTLNTVNYDIHFCADLR